jgi:hypothetical protein
MDENLDETMRQAAREATDGFVARQIFKAVVEPVERAIVESTNPSTLLEVESAFGVIRDADPNHPSNTLPDMAQAVEDAVRDAVDRAS